MKAKSKVFSLVAAIALIGLCAAVGLRGQSNGIVVLGEISNAPQDIPASDFIAAMRRNHAIADAVKSLAKDGTICEVLGHRWQFVPHVTAEYRSEGYPEHRACTICGVQQSKEPGDWK